MINLAWGGYTNGRIDTGRLVDVSGRGDYLESAAAYQFLAMQAACKRSTGFVFQPASGSSAYRSLAIQQDFYNRRIAYLTGKGPFFPVAAVPGTSNHGWGRAVDITISRLDPGVWAWMHAHAHEYGYDWATGRASGEDWHWESLTPPGTILAGGGSAPLTEHTPTQEERDDMTATKDASIVRNYEREGAGAVATALIYPDGQAVALSSADDVDAAVIAHLQVYGIARTDDGKYTTVRDQYGAQLNEAQWRAFWAKYPGKKIGSF